MKTCLLCDYKSEHKNVQAHMIRKHNNDSSFVLCCKLCCKSYTKYDSLRKHVYRKRDVEKHSAFDLDTSDIFMFEDKDINLDTNNFCDNDLEENMAEVKNQCAIVLFYAYVVFIMFHKIL